MKLLAAGAAIAALVGGVAFAAPAQADEHQFVENVWNSGIPMAYIPGGHDADAQATAAAGYRACAAMDEFPDNGFLATQVFYAKMKYTIDEWFYPQLFMVYAANGLCPRHSDMWADF